MLRDHPDACSQPGTLVVDPYTSPGPLDPLLEQSRPSASAAMAAWRSSCAVLIEMFIGRRPSTAAPGRGRRPPPPRSRTSPACAGGTRSWRGSRRGSRWPGSRSACRAGDRTEQRDPDRVGQRPHHLGVGELPELVRCGRRRARGPLRPSCGRGGSGSAACRAPRLRGWGPGCRLCSELMFRNTTLERVFRKASEEFFRAISPVALTAPTGPGRRRRLAPGATRGPPGVGR